MTSVAESATEHVALRERVTLTISPMVLAEIDRARGAASRSQFVELGSRLLAALLEQGEAKTVHETAGATEGA